MIFSGEENVTKILSASEILQIKNQSNKKFSNQNYAYNLGEYLKTATPEPSRFGNRYIFVK